MSEIEKEIDELNGKAWALMLSSPEEALGLAERSLASAEEAGYAAGLAEARLNVGWCENYLTRPGPAIASFQKSLDAFTALADDLGIMKALNALGVVYFDLGRYDRAMDYYTQSLEEARKTGNRLREAVTISNIGEICLNLGELKEALDYFLRAYETVPDDGESELVSNVLLNIGTTFLRMENFALAKEFSERALDIAQKAGDKIIMAQCLLALGRIAQASENFAEAEAQYLKSLSINDELKNAKQRVEVLLDLGSIYVHGGQIERALKSYTEALSGAESISAKGLIHQAYERLSEAHESLGDYPKALDYYRRFARYEREVMREDTSRKIKNITVQYEVEKSRQEAEIYRLRNIELKEKTEQLEEANKQILSIAELGRQITSSLDFDTVVSTLYESLQRHLDVAVFGIAIYDEEEASLEWRIFIESGKRIHREPQPLDYKRSYAAWCIKNMKVVFIKDSELENREYLEGGRKSVGAPASSLVYLPLTIEKKVIGVLTVQSYKKGAYSEQNRVLLEALGPYVSIAIENSLIHDRLAELNRAIIGEKAQLEEAAQRSSHLANHDSLTGLPNRRLLFELLQKSFDLASRNKSLVAVVYIDLDNFKPINDHFGHSAGDRALVILAERLRAVLRASDTVARVGGDEFIAVLTNAHDREDIELAVRKILEECAKPIPLEGAEDKCQVSLSMGIAIYPDDGERMEEIVNNADEAMYRVKRGTKNSFSFYTP
jgi:diguanylate cyclase (GGDEF)-like protein